MQKFNVQKERPRQEESQFQDAVKIKQDLKIEAEFAFNDNPVPRQKDIKQDSTTLTDLSFDCLVKPVKIENNNPKTNTQTNLTITIQTEQKLSSEIETKIKNAANVEGKNITELNLESLDEVKADDLKSNVQYELESIKTTDTIVETKSKILSPDMIENKNLQSKEEKVSEKIDKEAENESYEVNIEQFMTENDLESEIKVNNKVTTELAFNEQDKDTNLSTEKDLTIEPEHNSDIPLIELVEESTKLNLQNIDQNDSKHQDIADIPLIELVEESTKLNLQNIDQNDLKHQDIAVVPRLEDVRSHKKHPVSRVIQHHEQLAQCLSARHENRCHRKDGFDKSKSISVIELSRPRGRRTLETIRQREVMNNGPPFIEGGWMGNDTPCNYSTAHQEFFRREVTRPRTLANPPAVLRTGCGYTNNTQKYESTTKATYRDPEKLYAEEHEKKLHNNNFNQNNQDEDIKR